MAKKFEYKLQSVLNLRTHKVSEAKESLNIAVKSRIEKEQEIQYHDKIRKELLNQKANSGKILEYQAKYYHIMHLEYQIDQFENDKVQLLEIEKLRRGNLTNAMKNEKVLVKLKEKKHLVHKYEQEKEEVKFFDEIAMKKTSFED